MCFELGIGILNAPRKIFLAVHEPILKLQGLVAVKFQGCESHTKRTPISNLLKTKHIKAF